METSASVVRLAALADHGEIWRLLLMAHRENALFNLAPQKVEAFVYRALYADRIAANDTAPRALIGVIGPKGKLEALVFVLISQFWYSYDLHIEELIVYVDPECRRSSHAKTMIQWMKDSADTLGIPLLTGILSTDRTEAKIRLYDKNLPRVGAFYLYPIRGKSVKRDNRMDKQAWLDAS